MAFLDEVAQKARVLRELIGFYGGEGADLLDEVWHLASKRPRSLVFTGMGTSEYVCQVLVEYLAHKSPVPVCYWEAGELLHYGLESIRDDDVVIAVSQSGESVETRRITEYLRRHQRLITVTNDAESYMARHSCLNLPMLAGEEASISNKTYSNSMAVLLLLGRALVGEDPRPILEELEDIAQEMDDFLARRQGEVAEASQHLREATFLYFIARGPALAAARQAALTYQEGVHLYTTVLPGGSFRHGPFEIVGQGHYAVVFAPDGHGGDLLRKLALEMADIGSRVVLMTSGEVPRSPNLVRIMLKHGRPDLFPLATAVVQELLLHRMAADRGIEAGVFRRGSKVTSSE